MGVSWSLTCVECPEFLNLGKIVGCDTFDGCWYGNGDKERRVEGVELLRLVERFMILHMGHELRLLPDLYLGHVDANLDNVEAEADELMQRPVEDMPFWETGEIDTPMEIARRLTAMLQEREKRQE